jgi:hypothetical protein
LIIIQAIILLASIFFIEITLDKEDEIMEMTLREFMEDYEDSDGDGYIDNLKSFNFKDKVRISDIVANKYFKDFGRATLIICERSFPILLSGGAENIELGDPIMVVWDIGVYNIKGITMELPEELNRYYLKEYEIFLNFTSPEGEMNFSETSPGNFTGGLVFISYDVKIRDCKINITDASDGFCETVGPPMSGYQYTTSGGLGLKYTDINRNSRIDIGDKWNISCAAHGDQIKLTYETLDVIAIYTFS